MFKRFSILFILVLILFSFSAYASEIAMLSEGETLSRYAIIRQNQGNSPSYFLKITSKNSVRIVSSEGKFGPFESIQNPVFSSSKNSWAFVAKKNKKFYLYMSQKTNFGPFEYLGKPKVSSDESTWIFSAKTTNGTYLYILKNITNLSLSVTHIESLIFTNISSNKSGEISTNIITKSTTNTKTSVYNPTQLPSIPKGAVLHTNIIQKNEIKGPFKEISEYAISDNGKHWACLAKTSKGWFLEDENGEKNGPYNHASQLQIHPTGNLVSFIGEKSFLWSKAIDFVINERAYGAFDQIGKFVSDSSGKKWVFTARQGQNWFVVTSDDARLGPFQKVGTPYFSPQETTWALTTKDNNGWHLYIGSKQSFGPYKQIAPPTFSKDDQKWVFRFKKDSGWYILFNDKNLYGPYIKMGYVAMNDSWSRIAFAVLKKDGIYVLFNDGKEFGPYENKDPDSPNLNLFVSFSPSGNNWFFRAYKLDGTVLVINGKEYGPFEFATLPIYSPNEKSWGFWNNGKTHKYNLFLNKGSLAQNFINVDYLSPHFSDDGQKWFVKVEDFDGWYLINSKKKKYGPFNSEPNLIYAPNLKYWILVSNNKDGKYNILTWNNKKFGPYNNAYLPLLSQSGQSWAALVEKKGQTYLLLNDKEYANVITFKTFASGTSTTFCWIENQGNKISITTKTLK